MKKWERGKLEPVYAFCNVRQYSFWVKECGNRKMKLIYLIQGVGMSGKQEILDIRAKGEDSLEYWMNVLSLLKERGAEQIMLFYSGSIPNLEEAVKQVYQDKPHSILTRKDYEQIDVEC